MGESVENDGPVDSTAPMPEEVPKVYAWMIEDSDRFAFMTDLRPIFEGMDHFQRDYDWLVSDLELLALHPITRMPTVDQNLDYQWIDGPTLTERRYGTKTPMGLGCLDRL